MTSQIRLGIKCKIVSTGPRCAWKESHGQVVTICAGPHKTPYDGWHKFTDDVVWSIDRAIVLKGVVSNGFGHKRHLTLETMTLPTAALQPLPEHAMTTWGEIKKLTGWQPSEV